LHEAVRSGDPLIAEAARHLMDAGGKRFRPLLTALAAQFGVGDRDEVVLAGAVVELTHLATLYHDDVMAEAAVRRGAPSANSRWGNSVAILVGDFLFARAADIAAELGVDAVRIQAHTFERLVHGQIAETVGPRYGESMGIAFQLSDDLLDIASDADQSGKTPGTDLREGVPTLPVLYALAAGESDAPSVRLREILAAGPVTDDALHSEALGLLRESTALKKARETVRAYAEQARSALTPLPDTAPRHALQSLCMFITDRTG
jgi:heptaprenyl diphosphate synthase